MRGTVIVETQAEHDAWLAKQQSYWDVNNAPATPAADTAAAVASTTMNN
jgi:heme/copper-type cytochrome/quinol oxidase subunit 2